MTLLEEIGMPERGWVFTNERGEPLRGLSPVTRSIWPALDIPRFTVHDLRRSAATGMTSMGIDRSLVGKILNHSDRSTTSIYDRFAYDAPKRNALNSWAARLQEIVAGKPAPEKVVTLERA